MSIQRLLRYRTTGIFRVVIVLLTQSNCTSIFDGAFDNDVLELGGDWPWHFVSRGIVLFREGVPQNNSEYAEVN